MAAKQSGESRQGLIISLVCFVLLSIVLGVTTYMGYGVADEKTKAAADDKAKAAAAKKDADWYKYRALETQRFAGLQMSKEESADLQALRQGSPSGPGQDGFAKAIEGASKDLTLPGVNLIESYSQRVERLNRELGDARTKLDQTDTVLKRAKSSYEEALASKDAEIEEITKKLRAAQKQNLDDKTANDKALEDNIAKFEQLNKDNENLRKKADADLLAWEKERKKLMATIGDLETTKAKLIDKNAPPDWTTYDQPKGKIVELDPRGEIAYINLGSADMIRPQQNLTFSVFSQGRGDRPSREYKGSLEVLEVLGAHFSKAKLIEIVDPNRNPIMVGDVLINPTWSPFVREHIAIAGLIDLTRDHRHNIDEFMRNLERQGIVVDAYQDLSDNSIKGPGMTLKTAYLVVGDTIEPGQEEMLKGDRTKVNEKMDVNVTMTAMREEAKKLGVTVIPLRRFVQLVGYKMPKGAGVSRSLDYQTKPKPTKAAAPAPKEEKKEDTN